ncbi:hypothetical protein B5E41_22515 [Rhizobium esperanzae]|uniref:Uncharacterized protein n=1 Tax=Rhizobium esperanzae TaxID=1967781 RepID=A0A246DQL7_9HYPH|nr:hypothetical protein B5E41_22515 [Rhizobium esperanzae]
MQVMRSGAERGTNDDVRLCRAAPSSGPTGHLLPAGEKRGARGFAIDPIGWRASERAVCVWVVSVHLASLLPSGEKVARRVG